MKNHLKKILSFLGLLTLTQKFNKLIGNDIFLRFFLKISLRLFKKKYDQYWSSVVSDVSLTEMKKSFKDIQANGFTKIENFYNQQEINQFLSEIRQLKGFEKGKYKTSNVSSYKNFIDDGICALGINKNLKSCYTNFTKDERLLNLARAVYGTDTKLTASSILCKYGKDKIDSSNVPHWDDWMMRLKVFILLNDVKMENAPMIYVKGSHKKNIPWRLDKDFASIFLSPEASAGGSWWAVENLNLDKIYFTGKAGTCFIFDATGIHAGTQLQSGKRLMLMNMYTKRDYIFKAY